MEKNISEKLPPFREEYKLTDDDKAIISRFKEELASRLGGVSVSIDIYKENHLAYPSVHSGTVHFEVRVGNWRRVQVISEMELDNLVSGSFFYFCRRLVDGVIADLLKIGASRA
jgi:hypothetical protein